MSLNLAYRRPRIVEIAGLAGAGKSTLTARLGKCEAATVRGLDYATPDLKSHIKLGRYTLQQLIRCVPLLLHLKGDAWQLSKEDLKKILYLEGWHRMLHSQQVALDRTVIVDQGPLFCLATLRAFGPSRLRGTQLNWWWRRALRKWARQLDTVVWLDCPRETLIERVASRRKVHAIQGLSLTESHNYLDAYHESYQHTLADLGQWGQVETVRFDTSIMSPGAIAAELLRRWTSRSDSAPSQTAVVEPH